jgi:hypothetical protein
VIGAMRSEGPRLFRCLSVSTTVKTIQLKSTDDADKRVSPAHIATLG